MLLRVVVTLSCILWCLPIYAGSFKVFPLKLTFDDKNKTSLFRITNTGASAVTVQLEGVSWYQDKNGDDQYEKSKEIIFFPKIIDVQKGEERVVRVAYRGNPAIKQEKSYRLFAQELPKKSEATGALSFALRFSVPVFVTTRSTRSDPSIIAAGVQNGSAVVTVANQGNQHMVVTKISAEGYDRNNDSVFKQQTKGWYVLPNSQRPFLVPLNEAECRAASTLVATIEVNRKTLSKTVAVNPGQCTKVVTADKKKTKFSR